MDFPYGKCALMNFDIVNIRNLCSVWQAVYIFIKLNYLSYLKGMNLPKEAYEILIPVVLLALAMAIVSYITKRGRNFRSRRNKKARKQF